MLSCMRRIRVSQRHSIESMLPDQQSSEQITIIKKLQTKSKVRTHSTKPQESKEESASLQTTHKSWDQMWIRFGGAEKKLHQQQQERLKFRKK